MKKTKQKKALTAKQISDSPANTTAVAEENKVNIKNKNKGKTKNKKNNKDIGLKLFGVILSALITIVSLCMFLMVFDFSNPTDLKKLYLTAPLIGQILIAIVVTTDFSITKNNKKPNTAIPASVKLDTSDNETVIAEDDDLLIPEIDVNIRKNPSENLGALKIENFYNNEVEIINGNMYTSVVKFDETIRALEALGATDMELIKVNMAGNTLFDEMLSQSRSQKTLTAKEVTAYFMSKPGTYTIKKRGRLNWTFKYSFKSFGMIRESKDNYKVSIKCYPDAASKLNDVYMALDDSNFPSGPLWFCFNELRNLPPRVVKWLIDTSFQISTLQQTKTDQLREFKTPADMEIDLHDIASRYKSKQNVIVYPKFTLIFTKSSKADLFTYLEKPPTGVDVSQYTKEYYYKFTIADLAISMLCGKGISDDFVVTFMEHIEEILM